MRLSFYRTVTVTQFGMYTKVCFDDQRSEHSFVADRSGINLVDDGNNAMSVRRYAIDSCYCSDDCCVMIVMIVVRP